MLKITLSGNEYTLPVCKEEMTFEQYFRLAKLKNDDAISIAASFLDIDKSFFGSMRASDVPIDFIFDALSWLNETALRELLTMPCEIPKDVVEKMTLGTYAEIMHFVEKNREPLSIYRFVVAKVLFDGDVEKVDKLPAFQVLQQGNFFLKYIKSLKPGSPKREKLIRRVLKKFLQMLAT